MNSFWRRAAGPGGGAFSLSLCVLLIVPVEVAGAQAPAAAQAAAAAARESSAERIPLTAGRSTVLTTDFDVKRIAVANPAIADAVVVEPRQVLIDGKASGTVSLLIWGTDRRVQYDVVVEPAVTTLQQQLHLLFPGEDIQATFTDEAIILSGSVSNTAAMLKAGEIARLSSAKSKVVNLLQIPGASKSQQVMLQVRFAEINRRALTELGVSLFTGPTGYKNWVGRSTTGQFAAPGFENLKRTDVGGQVTETSGEFTFSDFLNLFVMNTKYNVGALIRALKTQGYFQSLAEPNLIAYNGQEASFLAGGEIPIPVVQGLAGQVTIVFKEFGIRLAFTPTIAGDTIRLKVRPEVSTLDFNNGITLQGFRIPALSTRRAETDVELRDGQSFAIAGLLDNLAQEDRMAWPVLGSLPIIGSLFRSKANRSEQTELMVLITPRLVRPLDPDEIPPLPTAPGLFLKPGGDVGSQFEGGGGLADAPPARGSNSSPAEPRAKNDRRGGS